LIQKPFFIFWHKLEFRKFWHNLHDFMKAVCQLALTFHVGRFFQMNAGSPYVFTDYVIFQTFVTLKKMNLFFWLMFIIFNHEIQTVIQSLVNLLRFDSHL